MHIHPSSPNSSQSPVEEELAATKIQAGFRGYRVRKQLKDTTGSSLIVTNNSRKEQQQQQRKMGKENKTNGIVSGLLGVRKVSIEDKSATKIQAGVRGFLVRKKQKQATDAATKIQASFRGFKARKDIMKIKQK